jgi:hypothetical protein
MLKSRKKNHARSFDRLDLRPGKAHDHRALDEQIAAIIREASPVSPPPSTHQPVSPKNAGNAAASPRALWIPQGKALEEYPPEVRQAVAEILEPTYRELVLEAPTAMERSLGSSMVRLIWFEILDQHDFTSQESLGLPGEMGPDLDKAVNRCLKLIAAKLRISNFLFRLREQRLKNSPFSPRPVPTGAVQNVVDWREPFRTPSNSCENEELPPKNQSAAETSPSKTEDPRPKTQSDSCENQEMAPKCPTVDQSSTAKTEIPSPKTHSNSCQNQEMAPKYQIAGETSPPKT